MARTLRLNAQLAGTGESQATYLVRKQYLRRVNDQNVKVCRTAVSERARVAPFSRGVHSQAGDSHKLLHVSGSTLQ